jgi:hypothetical protein
MMNDGDLDEDSVPPQEVEQPKKPPKKDPVESTSDFEGPNFDAGNGAQLVSLMKFHPFIALFVHLAKSRYPIKKSDKSRVEQLKAEHPSFYSWCVACDFLLTLIFALLLVAVVAVTAWKTLIGPISLM